LLRKGKNKREGKGKDYSFSPLLAGKALRPTISHLPGVVRNEVGRKKDGRKGGKEKKKITLIFRRSS